MIEQKYPEDGYIELIMYPTEEYDMFVCTDDQNGHFVLKTTDNNIYYWDTEEGDWEDITDRVTTEEISTYKKHKLITSKTRLVLPIRDKMLEEDGLVEVYCFKVFPTATIDSVLNDNIEKICVKKDMISKDYIISVGVKSETEQWFYSEDFNALSLVLRGIIYGLYLARKNFT